MTIEEQKFQDKCLETIGFLIVTNLVTLASFILYCVST